MYWSDPKILLLSLKELKTVVLIYIYLSLCLKSKASDPKYTPHHLSQSERSAVVYKTDITNMPLSTNWRI